MDEDVRAQLDDVAGFSVGSVLLSVAIAGALIDSGAVQKEAILGIVNSMKTMFEIGPMGIKALDQFAMLLEASAGSLGHEGNFDFDASRQQIERIFRPRKSGESD